MTLFFSKYYLDVRRREDAFDLSGPYLPKEDPTPLRAVSKTTMFTYYDQLFIYLDHKLFKIDSTSIMGEYMYFVLLSPARTLIIKGCARHRLN